MLLRLRLASTILCLCVCTCLPGLSLTACSSSDADSASSAKEGLAGTWLVTRTLVTPVDGLPQGYTDQQTWTFTTSDSSATLTTSAGSVGGTWGGASWLFETDYTDPRTGMPTHLKIEIIATAPLKGTLENTSYDPTGYRPPSTEAFKLEGVRQ